MPKIGKVNPMADIQEAIDKMWVPSWKGPTVDGVTQSLLGVYYVCTERFRLLTIDGLRPVRKFDPTIEFGQMFHLCEELYKGGKDWREPLGSYCLLYTSPSPRDLSTSRMPSSA